MRTNVNNYTDDKIRFIPVSPLIQHQQFNVFPNEQLNKWGQVNIAVGFKNESYQILY